MDLTTRSPIQAIVYQCPIEACGWELTGPAAPEDPTKWPTPPDATLPDMAKQMARHVAAMTDAALQEHLDTHTTLEWVQENARLRQKVADLEDERCQCDQEIR